MKFRERKLWALGFRLLLSAIMVVLITCNHDSKPERVTYSYFQSMSLEELKTLQVKLTFVGEQNKILYTVVITSTFNESDLSVFVPLRLSGIHYGNDDIAVKTYKASPSELSAMIQNISSLTVVTSGGVSTDAFLSFAMASGHRVFETILNPGDTGDIFEQIYFALQANQNCSEALASQWLAMGLGIGPLNPDTDGDELSDALEAVMGTDPMNPDSDMDGKADGAEVNAGTDPLNPLSQ
jgi:hypothetical protein